MDIQEKRVMGALLLLLGFSFLAIGIYTGQLSKVIELLKNVFRPF
ncbi:MAG: hypothetical protein ACPL0C_04925 [Candidatus Bathyarchaeales archaeon]